jgi:carbonic anhydrase/acetyltransferase-like protein (isoleucine patch superfamily)
MTLYSLGSHTPLLPQDFFWIAPSAAVIGRVRLGAEASVWFGATVRGDVEDISIGAGSNIQDNAVLHADPGFPLRIGRKCTIGHAAIVHGCTIGNNSLIGMGATVLNGAMIGDNCLIGANALITEGKTIPDGSLVVGAPGKVVRQLTAEEIAGLTRSANHYIGNARKFSDELRTVEPPAFDPA